MRLSFPVFSGASHLNLKKTSSAPFTRSTSGSIERKPLTRDTATLSTLHQNQPRFGADSSWFDSVAFPSDKQHSIAQTHISPGDIQHATIETHFAPEGLKGKLTTPDYLTGALAELFKISAENPCSTAEKLESLLVESGGYITPLKNLQYRLNKELASHNHTHRLESDYRGGRYQTAFYSLTALPSEDQATASAISNNSPESLTVPSDLTLQQKLLFAYVVANPGSTAKQIDDYLKSQGINSPVSAARRNLNNKLEKINHPYRLEPSGHSNAHTTITYSMVKKTV